MGVCVSTRTNGKKKISSGNRKIDLDFNDSYDLSYDMQEELDYAAARAAAAVEHYEMESTVSTASTMPMTSDSEKSKSSRQDSVAEEPESTEVSMDRVEIGTVKVLSFATTDLSLSLTTQEMALPQYKLSCSLSTADYLSDQPSAWISPTANAYNAYASDMDSLPELDLNAESESETVSDADPEIED